ncbi:MAG TPA: sugar MFS transporter [Flavobacteriales bacterium]|jgi:FHS family L-fucose permease-like MFS transporter|nr:sugar MFS transporter [Flavobacteriales bacterium]
MTGTSRTTSAIFMLGALFFLFGFVTWINGPLISYLKIICELDSGAEPFYVTFAFYIAYFFTALPMARVLERTGMKNGMMYGLLTMALGALLFVPAAQQRSYGLFLLGLFVIGTGLSLLQTASNPYITVVGPIESAAARISVMGICNKLAGVLAPVIIGSVLLSDADALRSELAGLQDLAYQARLDEVASRVMTPYVIMAGTLVLLAFGVRYSPLPEIDAEVDRTTVATTGSVLGFPHLVLGAVALFLYVGVEVMAGDTIGTYGESQGVPLSEAKHLTSYTLVCMVLGYVIGIATIPRFISQTTALICSAVLGMLLTSLVLLSSGYPSVLLVALLGLANALVWPAIWPLAISDLGRFTKQASAILIMAIAGGAILPLIYGQLAGMSAVGPRMAYALMLPCYGFMLWYATTGSKWRSWGRAA